MKKRNCWVAFGISAAAAATLISAIILIAGVLETGSAPTPLPMPLKSKPQAKGYDLGVAAGNLKIVSPKPGDKLASPLIISGEAKGWYFEGSFPIELKDANGATLASGVAQAQGDWMNPDFVPFIATLDFAAPTTPTGMLILKKDNPSGLPQYDAQISVSVTFSGYMPNGTLDNCRPTGCSGELCSDKEMFSPCLFRAAFACYNGALCARQPGGKCGWTMTPELRSCLDGADRRTRTGL